MYFLITADFAFRKPLATLLLSITRNEQSENHIFYLPFIEGDDCDRINSSFLEKYIKQEDKIVQFAVPKECRTLFQNSTKEWTYHVWLKLTCLFYLPTPLNRLLYIDSDCIIERNIISFYNHEMTCPVLGVNEYMNNNDKLNRMGLPQTDIYFCGGFLLLNPMAFVNEFHDIYNLKKEYDNLPFRPRFNEQDFLNYKYFNITKPVMDKKYMFFVSWYHDNSSNVSVYHYAGDRKPWSLYDYHYNIGLFYKYWKYAIKSFGFFAFVFAHIRSVAFLFSSAFKVMTRKFSRSTKKGKR